MHTVVVVADRSFSTQQQTANSAAAVEWSGLPFHRNARPFAALGSQLSSLKPPAHVYRMTRIRIPRFIGRQKRICYSAQQYVLLDKRQRG